VNERQLSLVLITLTAGIAVGFLALLFRSPANVAVDKRLTDVVEETKAGTLPGLKKAAEQEEVNIEGTFETFDGKPGQSEQTWLRFRGDDFSNIRHEGPKLADSWPSDGPPQLWAIDLSEGHAGATVWNGRVFLADYDEEKQGDALRCFSIEDGKEIWRRWYHAPTKRNHGVSRTIPAVTEKYTVSMGPRCFVMCVDTATGKFRWGIDLVEEYGANVPMWYTGQCPLIDGNTAVLAPGGKALMLGVDCETGDVVWQTPNPDGWKMSHSSIIPMQLLGKRTYVYCSENGVYGVSAEDGDRGQLLWKTAVWAHPVTSPSPVRIDDERVFLTCGYGGGSMMLKLKKNGDAIETETLFELSKKVFSCEQQTPIFHDNHLFAVLPKDAAELRAQFACLTTDGKLAWTSGQTERFGLGPFLMADGKIFILNDNGELTLIRASVEKYERLAKCRPLKGHDAWAPMALVDGKLLLRDSKQMICLDVRAI